MVSIPQLLERTGDGLFDIDQAQRIVFCNRAAQSIFGLTDSGMLGRRCYDVLRGCDDQGKSVCGPNCWIFRAVSRGEELPCQEMLLQGPDGQHLRCSLSVITIADQEDDTRAVVLVRPSRAVAAPEPLPVMTALEPDEAPPAEPAIRCFGTFEIWAQGKPLVGPPLSRNKVKTALRFLIHRRGYKVQHDELAEVLWPEGFPSGSSSALCWG